MPRLLAALGVPAPGRAPDPGEASRPVADAVVEGLDYWVPTLAGLREQGVIAPAPRPGRDDPLDPRPALRADGAAAPAPRHARVLEVPSGLRGGRWRVSPRAGVGLVVVLVLAVCLFTARVVLAREAATPVDVAPGRPGSGPGLVSRATSTFPGAGGAAAGEAAGAGVPRAGPGGTSAPAGVRVHVVGQVRRPGVVRLPAGSRVLDAVAAAGGATAAADLSAVNLARVVADGEQVRVPRPGETPPAPAPGAGGGGAGPSGGAASTPVDLNAADEAALDALPGVGPVLAGRILAWRQEHGRFTTVEELGEVSGIGDRLLAQLSPLVRV